MKSIPEDFVDLDQLPKEPTLPEHVKPIADAVDAELAKVDAAIDIVRDGSKLAPGEYLFYGGRAYIQVPSNSSPDGGYMEEVSSYVKRLERAILGVHHEVEACHATIQEFLDLTFFERLLYAFRGLFSRGR